MRIGHLDTKVPLTIFDSAYVGMYACNVSSFVMSLLNF